MCFRSRTITRRCHTCPILSANLVPDRQHLSHETKSATQRACIILSSEIQDKLSMGFESNKALGLSTETTCSVVIITTDNIYTLFIYRCSGLSLPFPWPQNLSASFPSVSVRTTSPTFTRLLERDLFRASWASKPPAR